MEEDVGKWTLEQIPRANNMEADTLAKIAALNTQPPKGVFKEILWHSSLEKQQAFITVAEDNWMTSIIKYLSEGILPIKEKELRKSFINLPIIYFLMEFYIKDLITNHD